MQIKLSDKFNYKKLLRFTLPSIAMMIFTSIYGVVDGFFISNFAGKTPFAAVNLIYPFLMILSTVGFMFGTGGSALVAKTFGEGEPQKANRLFSLFVYFSFALGLIFAVLGFVFIRPISALLGAEGQLLQDCVTYSRILLLSLPFLVLQFLFHSFFVTAEKPNLGLVVTLSSGIANMVLDFILVLSLPQHLKLTGAAIATALSQVIGGAVPLVYFFSKNKSILRLGKTNYNGKAILKASTNGSSEFMSNVSMNLVAMLYNIQLIKYAGENGIAAYGVIMYVSFIFAAVFIGYSVGIAPVISFNFGAQNHTELKGLLKRSSVLILIFGAFMVALGLLLNMPLSKMFVGYDTELLNLTVRGFKIFSLSFIFMGFAIFYSAFFTALNDGLTSALISFLRTLVFQVSAVLLLPLILGIDGIWYSILAAEFMAVVFSLVFLFAKKNKFRY